MIYIVLLQKIARTDIHTPGGTHRYDRGFLLQFRDICTERPYYLPRLSSSKPWASSSIEETGAMGRHVTVETHIAGPTGHFNMGRFATSQTSRDADPLQPGASTCAVDSSWEPVPIAPGDAYGWGASEDVVSGWS